MSNVRNMFFVHYGFEFALQIVAFLAFLPELGVIVPSLSPGGACPTGYPVFHCTLMSPNRPFRVTFASHVPVSIFETCRAREANPTWQHT